MSSDNVGRLTTMRQFMGQTAVVNSETSSTKISLNAIQDISKPGSTLTFDLPATWGTISDPTISAEIELRYKINGTLVQPLKVGAFKNGEWDNLTAAQQGYYADQDDFQFQLINGSDYAMDFPTLLGAGSLFTWTLSQKETGVVIDQMTIKELASFNTLTMATAEPSDAYFADRTQELNVFQHCPAFDSTISPPSGVSDYLRCATAKIDGDYLVITKLVNCKVPLAFGETYPLDLMGDCRLDLQLSTDPNLFASVPKHYTGRLDSSLEFGSILSAGSGLIAHAEFLPVFNMNLTNPAKITLNPRSYGESSMLRIGLRGLRLDTDDLLSILGGPKAVCMQPNANDQMLLSVPACSALSSGVMVQFKIAALDICTFADTVLPTINNAANWVTLLEFVRKVNGTRVLRNISVPVFIPASKIAGFAVESPMRFQGNVVGSANDVGSYSATSFQGADLSMTSLANTGSVVMRFVDTLTIVLPIFGGVYGSLLQTGVTVGGNNYQVGAPQLTSLNTAPAAANQGIDMLATNFTIAYTVSTNSGSGTENNPFRKPATRPLARTSAAFEHWFTDAAATAVTGKPLSIQPTSWQLSKVTFKCDRLNVPAEIKEVMDDEFKSNGFRITRVATDTDWVTLPNAGPQTVTCVSRHAQMFGLIFGLHTLPSVYVPLSETALPAATFSELTLNQGEIQVVMRRPADLLCNFGGNWPLLYPSYQNYNQTTDSYNVCCVPKGPGGNEFTLGLLRDMYANSLGLGVEQDDDKNRSINVAALVRLRQQWNFYYNLGTDGGAAQIPPQSQFLFSFTPRIYFEPAAGYCFIVQQPPAGGGDPAIQPATCRYSNSVSNNIIFPNIRLLDNNGLGHSFTSLPNQGLFDDIYSVKTNLLLKITSLFRKQWVFTPSRSLGVGAANVPHVTILE